MSEPPPVVVARFLERTRAEGPGERTAVWVQGCSIRCPGCFNPHLFTPRGGTPVPPAELAARILATGTDGVTLLGGEPFDQAAGLAAVAATVRAAGRTVMTFTGYDHAELRSRADQGVAGLLAATDLLVAGPFRQDLIDRVRPWAGSTNQQFVHLTDRLPVDVTPDRLEVTVSGTGDIAVNGWADTETLDALLAGLQTRRLKPR
ncbi:anaerobic ribonucleoside-triphosphate reductase activating protein [Actinoplanes sp. SE50]|uniref:4Fe-4S single cluster domain-containing protein n=1 Tax=unclassified Actinoplanes TaxID=2626549 RepID=UPI00023ECB00|nr:MULTISPECIES: 4Fe-4S single cluster domain-containing protein [unclassified Actinoplanes]AEV83752.1 anaerobic ribonucleoside-triphosphate reductase activating protein [Actinoplanes sp. SE50/110]ATO82104.1 anaerobic ribonucleoside-triphosphate reductase activating protein [Actinoplanes sp. SE50]SLL99511.1 anaerobic ribonucleoside-triphosphate reductase activating protein [Actinoplanes sp. SE50/110]